MRKLHFAKIAAIALTVGIATILLSVAVAVVQTINWWDRFVGNAPIVYHARVLSEEGEPVIGAELQLTANGFGMLTIPGVASMRRIDVIRRVTDHEGRFYVDGITGTSIKVTRVDSPTAGELELQDERDSIAIYPPTALTPAPLNQNREKTIIVIDGGEKGTFNFPPQDNFSYHVAGGGRVERPALSGPSLLLAPSGGAGL